MEFFKKESITTHSLKESDFKSEEIHHVKGDKVHEDEIQIYMTVAFREGKLYVLSARYE